MGNEWIVGAIAVFGGAIWVVVNQMDRRLEALERSTKQQHKAMYDLLERWINAPQRTAERQRKSDEYMAEFQRTMPGRVQLMTQRFQRGEPIDVGEEELWADATPDMDRPSYLEDHPT